MGQISHATFGDCPLSSVDWSLDSPMTLLIVELNAVEQPCLSSPHHPVAKDSGRYSPGHLKRLSQIVKDCYRVVLPTLSNPVIFGLQF